MKLIIYCDSCGVLLPNAVKRGDCCASCQAGQKAQRSANIASDEIDLGRRPSARKILAELRRAVKFPAAV